MESVGTTIRTARLKAGLSLEQVSVKTCISVRILQGLEDDDFSQITSSFFYKSFVRQFCSAVGLPAESLQDSIAVAAAKFPDPLMPGQGETFIRSSLIKPLRKQRKARSLYPAVSLAVMLVACSGFYAYWEQVRNTSLQTLAQRVLVLPSQLKMNSAGAGSAPAIAQPKAVVPAAPDAGFRVEVSAVERTWLSIKADGKQVYAGTLEVDQTKLLEGHREGQLRTGNAGGVNIVFNGRAIGLAGPHGTIRTVVFKRDNYEVLPEPVHAALNLFPRTIAGWLRLPPVR